MSEYTLGEDHFLAGVDPGVILVRKHPIIVTVTKSFISNGQWAVRKELVRNREDFKDENTIRSMMPRTGAVDMDLDGRRDRLLRRLALILGKGTYEHQFVYHKTDWVFMSLYGDKVAYMKVRAAPPVFKFVDRNIVSLFRLNSMYITDGIPFVTEPGPKPGLLINLSQREELPPGLLSEIKRPGKVIVRKRFVPGRR